MSNFQRGRNWAAIKADFERKYPHSCNMPRTRGPRPERVDPTEFGHFGYLPLGDETAQWYFGTEQGLASFLERYG